MLRDDLVAGRCAGRFPDIILRTNQNDPMFQGGEFVEIKDAKTNYSISSFNSTMPSAYKNIRDHVEAGSALYREIKEADGIDPYHLETREVYYLIRGQQKTKCKVCLVYGGFFETVAATESIKSALKQSLNEAMTESGMDKPASRKSIDGVMKFDWTREHLAKVRHHKDASISIRMRVMAEVIGEANVLNSNQYPDIKDDTLNMIVPANAELSYERQEQDAIKKMAAAFNLKEGALPPELSVQKFVHLRDGLFVLFQTTI